MFEVPFNWDSMNDNTDMISNENMTTLIRKYFVFMHVNFFVPFNNFALE